MGGDAGSEGESEAEQKDTGCCQSGTKKNGKSEVLPLRPEASALDRPPKAPAMLSLPNDEHELGHTVCISGKCSHSVYFWVLNVLCKIVFYVIDFLTIINFIILALSVMSHKT